MHGGYAHCDSTPVTLMADEHLDNEQLAAFLDGRLPSTARTTAEAHLADCTECRDELMANSRLLERLPKPSLRRAAWWPHVGAAAAAAALIAVIVVPRTARTPTLGEVPAERVGAAETSRIAVVSPPEGASVDRTLLRFSWHPQDRASYRLTVTDSSGRMIWRTTTNDTVAGLPPTIALDAGGRFYWYVDALRVDGVSLTSGAHSFSTR
jgi:hypothetical protein